MDAPAKVIGQGVGKAIRFPMAFAVKFPRKEISEGHSYSLQISIRNKKNELLYINDIHVNVVPIGVNRTKFIDVPVVLVASKDAISCDAFYEFLPLFRVQTQREKISMARITWQKWTRSC